MITRVGSRVSGLQRFVSHQKSKAKGDKQKLADPDYYKGVTKLVKYDYKAKDLVFPINVPLKFKTVYSPKKNYLRTPKGQDFLPFQRMSGNEILLNMQNLDHFRNEEVMSCLDHLIRVPGATEIDWNNHELFQKLIHRVTKCFSQFKSEQIGEFLRIFKKLGIKHEPFWNLVESRFMEMHPSLKGRHFAAFFLHLMETESVPDSMKVELCKLLPRELGRFNQEDLAKAFTLVIKYDLLSDHLWHNHFHILFWRRTLWLGLKSMAEIIDGMVKIDYLQEVEWWNQSFLPAIDYFVDKLTEPKTADQLIESLKNLEAAQPEIEVKSYIKKLNDRVHYLNTQHVVYQNAQFYKMVLADLEYFKQKQLAELEHQSA